MLSTPTLWVWLRRARAAVRVSPWWREIFGAGVSRGGGGRLLRDVKREVESIAARTRAEEEYTLGRTWVKEWRASLERAALRELWGTCWTVGVSRPMIRDAGE